MACWGAADHYGGHSDPWVSSMTSDVYGLPFRVSHDVTASYVIVAWAGFFLIAAELANLR